MKAPNDMTPLEILHAMIDEDNDLITTETSVKKAWKALSPEQQRQACRSLYGQHRANVIQWRAAQDLPPIDWESNPIACNPIGFTR